MNENEPEWVRRSRKATARARLTVIEHKAELAAAMPEPERRLALLLLNEHLWAGRSLFRGPFRIVG